MRQSLSILFLWCACLYCNAQYSLEDRIYDYIDQHKDMAMQEMERYAIPASITLAQAIYATNAGTNKVSREAHNHFGITCHANEWNGETYYEDENRGADYCFRKYASVADSYRDHSIFISQRSRYNKLFYLPITDYKSWARGLQAAGYSGNAHYADTLISLIEKYYLVHYDRKVATKIGDTSALKATPPPVTAKIEEPDVPRAETKPATLTTTIDTPKVNSSQTTVKKDIEKEIRLDTTVHAVVKSKPKSTNHIFTIDPAKVPFRSAYYSYTDRPVYENNKTKFILAKAGDTYKDLAASMLLNEKELREYNDVYDDGEEPATDEVVYLEMKSTRSPVKYHKLETGDTYRYIAQKYAIQLKMLLKRNGGTLGSYDVGDSVCIGCK